MMSIKTRTPNKLNSRVFECDDVAYACVAVDHRQRLQQPLLSGIFFIVKSAHVCAVSAAHGSFMH